MHERTKARQPEGQRMTACGLAHHRPGADVRWTSVDPITGKPAILRGTVIAHRGDIRLITIRRMPDLKDVAVACSGVGKP